VSRANFGHGAENQNHQQKGGDAKPNQAQKASASAAAVNNPAASRIENRHRSFPPP
jgi:hypothetical protein